MPRPSRNLDDVHVIIRPIPDDKQTYKDDARGIGYPKSYLLSSTPKR